MQPNKAYFIIKRLFDFISSLLVILVFSWLLLILLIINLFATRGKPIYVDKRIGYKGKVLNLYKFRSMFKDAESHPERYLSKEQLEKWKNERKIENDPRITKFGRFLRKSSLDELPQLFNILFGSMSVVGPRPIVESEMSINYTDDEKKILVSAKPGLISNWAVNGRNDVTYKNGERQKLELEYFKKRSLGYDLKLMFRAIKVVISGKGAR